MKTARWLTTKPWHSGSEAYEIYCPGCECTHVFTVGFKDEAERQAHITYRGDGKCATWTFNGDFAAPTFMPSMLVQGRNDSEGLYFCCHSFVTNGRIQFLDDCTHELRGQTVSLPDVD